MKRLTSREEENAVLIPPGKNSTDTASNPKLFKEPSNSMPLQLLVRPSRRLSLNYDQQRFSFDLDSSFSFLSAYKFDFSFSVHFPPFFFFSEPKPTRVFPVSQYRNPGQDLKIDKG